MIRDTITAINDAIQDQLSTANVQIEGIVVPVHDQQEKTTMLMVADTDERFVINDRQRFQCGHLTDGTSIASQSTFGSLVDSIHDVRFVFVGLSKIRSAFDIAYQALEETSYVVIDTIDQDTLAVLTRYFRTKADQAKNYDPSLYAFAIRYHIEGCTDEDLRDLSEESELVQLDAADYCFPYTLPLTLEGNALENSFFPVTLPFPLS